MSATEQKTTARHEITRRPPALRRSWLFAPGADKGALMAAGSDWPVISNPDPWLGIEGMITRRNPRGGYDGALWAEQALDLETVLRIYTVNAATASGLADVTGSIEPGKSADLIVVDRDLFATAPDDLAETKVLQTWFEGRLVHERS